MHRVTVAGDVPVSLSGQHSVAVAGDCGAYAGPTAASTAPVAPVPTAAPVPVAGA
jgi:hypothetical protein